MKLMLVLKPSETTDRQVVEVHGLKITEQYEKAYLLDFITPLFTDGEDNPEREFIDGRDIKEVLDIQGHIVTKTEVDNLRDYVRKYVDGTYSSLADVHLISNTTSGGTVVNIASAYAPGTSTFYDDTPAIVHLRWSIADDSGAGFFSRLRITYSPQDEETVEDSEGRYEVQMTIVRGNPL